MAAASSSAIPPLPHSRSRRTRLHACSHSISRETHRLSSALLRTCLRAHRCATTINGPTSSNAVHLWNLVLQARELSEITCVIGVLDEVRLLDGKVRRLERRVGGIGVEVGELGTAIERVRRLRRREREHERERRREEDGNAGNRTTRLLKDLVRDIERMRRDLTESAAGPVSRSRRESQP